MLQLKRLLIPVLKNNKTDCVLESKKESSKNNRPKKRILLAACLSFLCSSSACTANVFIRNDTTTSPAILVNNKPFFPFGFYYVSYSSNDAKRLEDLHKIAEAGFNVMHLPLDLNDDSFLDEAARLGIYIVGEYNADPLSVVNRYKTKSAILGWNVGDDVDDGKKTANKISTFHKQVKVTDSQHITYISGYNPNKIGEFMNSSDLVGMQSYPVNSEPLSSTDYSISRAVKEATPYNRPIIANLQTFSWEAGRPPTSKEVRNMTYQSLINGVKGIIYYTYYDSTWDMSSHSDLWNGVKSLVPEIKQLSPILLNGKLNKINTGVQDVFAGAWNYQNQAVVVVVNTSNSITKQVSITLPPNRTSGVQAMFDGRPSGLTINGDKLSGSIKPKDVHIYSFKLSN